MSDRTWTRRIALTAAAGGFALALAAAPFAPNGDFPGLAPNAALAKGGGDNGGGNGRGHGKGGLGGSAPGQVIRTSADDGEDGPGHGHGLALGHDKDAVSGVQGGGSVLHPVNHGTRASLLGSLNAAHAIANGNTNDNLNSKVGQILEYMKLFNEYAEGEEGTTVGDVADALITASNKDLTSMELVEIESVVSGVNDLIENNEVGITSEEVSITSEEEAVALEIKSPE